MQLNLQYHSSPFVRLDHLRLDHLRLIAGDSRDSRRFPRPRRAVRLLEQRRKRTAKASCCSLEHHSLVQQDERLAFSYLPSVPSNPASSSLRSDFHEPRNWGLRGVKKAAHDPPNCKNLALLEPSEAIRERNPYRRLRSFLRTPDRFRRTTRSSLSF